jgi:hypothetical protein
MMVVLERDAFVLVGELSKPGRRSTFFGFENFAAAVS